MDLRTRTSLFCGALALAIAISILLRGRTRKPQILFAAFAADIGLWYLAQWLYHFIRAAVWADFTAILAVLLPQFALHLFDAILPAPERRSLLLRVAGLLAVPMVVLVLSPHAEHGLVRGLVFLYVFGLLAAGLVSLALRGRRSRSRATQRRVRFLVLIGALAAAFSLADFLWFIGAPLPPVGAVLSIVFLFVLAESMTRERLVDMYELLGTLVVSTALAFSLAGIFYLFVETIGGFDTMYLNAVLAGIVILVLFEPMRQKVEGYIHGVFFRERVDLEKAVVDARTLLLHALEVGEMMQVALSALERSHRATGAAIYLRDPVGSDFELGLSFGPAPPAFIDGATARPLLERLDQSTTLSLEGVARDVSERRRLGETREVAGDEQVLAAAELLGAYQDGLCIPLRAEDEELLGVLVVVDDRVNDAFTEDEIALLSSLAIQMGVVIANSRQYLRMQERDRLAALGQMAAGLAHEVKNPLGAIKGAAQLLSDVQPGSPPLDPASREFLDIILEEVDRLDRVVGSVLDYARPSKGTLGAVDLNGIVRRTIQVLSSSSGQGIQIVADPFEGLPSVRADAEHVRQVLMNLVRNAEQAGSRRVMVSTRPRRVKSPTWGTRDDGSPEWVELVVADDGPGLAPAALKNLFIPFFTTKNEGTGLGLAISQRLVQAMGGRIEVTSPAGRGACFTVVLPAAREPVPTPRPASASPRPDAQVEPGPISRAEGVPKPA